MRRNDEGAVAVVVAVLAVVLFGFGALVIDVGAMYTERRQLQNGADAGALAIAQTCLISTCPGQAGAEGSATGYAGSNDRVDGEASASTCGTGSADWQVCADPPAVPPGVKYVSVIDRTVSVRPDGTTDDKLPPILARVLDNSYDGKQVSAKSTVAWGYGTASGAPVLPFIMSVCEWQRFLSDHGGMGYADRPADLPDLTTDPGSSFPWDYEREVFTHAGGTECTFNPSGQTGADAQVSGDFGWLYDGSGSDKGDCTPTVTTDSTGDDTVPGKNGYEVCVKAWLDAHIGQVVDVPIYAEQPVKSTPTIYKISGWAPLYLTGYNLGGKAKSINRVSDPDLTTPACLSKDSTTTTEADMCLTGFLVKMPPSDGPVVGPSFGLGTTKTIIVE